MRLEERRERFINEAIAAGKIPEGRGDHYRRAWNENPVAAERLLAELAPGLLASGERPAVEPTRCIGPPLPAAQGEAVEAGGLPDDWFPGPKGTRAKRAEAEGGRQRVTKADDE